MTVLYLSTFKDQADMVRLLLENGANQSDLFEKWDKKKIVEEFLEMEIPNDVPEKRHTDEKCNVSFEVPNEGDWYVVWKNEDGSDYNEITILRNVKLVAIEPELVKGVYIQY